jgi:hypothetical protein
MLKKIKRKLGAKKNKDKEVIRKTSQRTVTKTVHKAAKHLNIMWLASTITSESAAWAGACAISNDTDGKRQSRWMNAPAAAASHRRCRRDRSGRQRP